MTNWKEIERIRKDARGFRSLAVRLRSLDGLTLWETDFLEDVAALKSAAEFSTRQGEKLLQIRDDNELVKTVHGFSVRTLLAKCHDARSDLSEHDEAWITAARARDPEKMRRRDVGRLLGCAKDLDLVEGYVGSA